MKDIELFYMSSSRIEDIASIDGYQDATAFGKRYNKAEDTKVNETPQAEVFHKFTHWKNRPPKQQEFVHYYRKANADFFASATERMLEGQLHRVARAWPSYMREYHLFALLAESGLFKAAVKTAGDDLTGGVDLWVSTENTQLGLASFVDTENSWQYLQRKRKRRKPDPEDGLCLYFPLNMEDPKVRCVQGANDPVYFYGEQHTDDIGRAHALMRGEGMMIATASTGRFCKGCHDPYSDNVEYWHLNGDRRLPGFELLTAETEKV